MVTPRSFAAFARFASCSKYFERTSGDRQDRLRHHCSFIFSRESDILHGTRLIIQICFFTMIRKPIWKDLHLPDFLPSYQQQNLIGWHKLCDFVMNSLIKSTSCFPFFQPSPIAVINSSRFFWISNIPFFDVSVRFANDKGNVLQESSPYAIFK